MRVKENKKEIIWPKIPIVSWLYYTPQCIAVQKEKQNNDFSVEQ